MYCKFCGNRIGSNITKCANCGAEIDLTDGGQSFFDDHELDAWKKEPSLKSSNTFIPRTEILEIENPGDDFTGSKKVAPQPGFVMSKPKYRRKKNPSGLMKLFNVSTSTKIIIFCIAAVLAIVLIYATIISVLNPKTDTEETTTTTTTGTEVTDESESAGPEINEALMEQQAEEDPDKKDAEEKEEEKEISEDKKDDSKPKKSGGKKGTKVISKGQLTVVNAKGKKGKCRSLAKDEVLYISIEDLLSIEGLEYCGTVDGKENHVAYDLEDDRVIEVEIGTDNVWFASNAAVQLKYDTLQVDDVIYVPAMEFLDEYGYKRAVLDGDHLYFKR